jgi:DNA-binding SARP family transcriptional activator
MITSLVSARLCGWPLREHIALLGCALTATEVGKLDEATRFMTELKAHSFYRDCLWHQWLAAMIEANLAERLQDRPRCLSSLRRASQLCAENGFDYGPLLYTCGNMMSRLLAIALTYDIASDQVIRIIRRHGLKPPDQCNEYWPWPVKVFTLGRFAIELDEPCVTPARKESRKALDLLKLLITLGNGDGVCTERLTSLLWPEADTIAARRSFENTLFRLRKILGENQLLMQVGTLRLNPDSCWIDLHALERNLHAALPANADQAMRLAEQAVDFNAGPYLPGEDRHAAVALKRERLQSRFLRRMELIGGILESEGRYFECAQLYRRVLENNPLAENIYRNLIGCLLQLGCRAEAFDAYRRCRHQLSVVLGIRPSPLTEALVSQLRDDPVASASSTSQ